MSIQLLNFQFIDCCIPLKYKDFEAEDLRNVQNLCVFALGWYRPFKRWNVILHREPCRVYGWIFKSAQGHSDSLLMLFPSHEPL